MYNKIFKTVKGALIIGIMSVGFMSIQCDLDTLSKILSIISSILSILSCLFVPKRAH